MRNVTATVKGDVLTITCNLAAPTMPSKTGKTEIIASTEGNVSVNGDARVKLGLNLYRTRS